MLEADRFAWTDVCLTLPKELTDRDAIAGPTTEVSAALRTAAADARSKGGQALAVQLQREIAARPDRDKFVRIGPGGSRAGERPGAGRLNGRVKTGHLWTPQTRPFPAARDWS